MDRDIGFIGLGNMGEPMARNLLQRGFRLRVYNRTAARTRELVRLGAVAVEVPADAVQADGLVITMVSDDPALEAMAGAIHDVGAEAAAGNVAKLAVNLMVLSSVETLAEVLELAARGGVDRRALAAALTERLFTGPVITGYAMRLASGLSEEKGFKVALALKDIDLVLRAAAAADASLPFAQVLRERLRSVYLRGLGERDVSALAADLAPAPRTGVAAGA